MTRPAEFPGYQECEKIPGVDINAYAEIILDPENPTGIALDSTWGYNRLDLESVVKAGETVTHLELAPTDTPTVLRYFREDGEIDCVTGDELSRIVSLTKLKDVDQEIAPRDGETYVFNGTTNKFEPYNVAGAIGDINTIINRLVSRITTLENKLSDIESIIPFWPTDKTMKLARGVINLYSDPNAVVTDQGVVTSLDKSHGIYTHALDTEAYGDRIAG